MSTNDIFARLRDPFQADSVSVKIQSTGQTKKGAEWALYVAYIDARDVMERLDSVLGPDRWRDEYVVHGAESGGWVVECRLWIDIDGSGEWMAKSDVGEGDDAKSAFSDALKRAAVKWGIGRHLYGLRKVRVYKNADGSYAVKADREKKDLEARNKKEMGL